MNASFSLPTGLLPGIEFKCVRVLGRGKPAVLNMNDLRSAPHQLAPTASFTSTVVLELDRARATKLPPEVERLLGGLLDPDGNTLLRHRRAAAPFGREPQTRFGQ